MVRIKLICMRLVIVGSFVCSGAPGVGQLRAQTIAEASGQPCQKNTFTSIAEHADEAYGRLVQTRSLSSPANLNRDTVGAIRQLSGLARALPAKLLVLTREADQVCGYLIDFAADAPVVEAKYAIGSVSEITQLSMDSRFAFGVYQSQATRAPQRLRGARAVNQIEPVAGVPQQAFGALGVRIFPVAVTSHLPKQGTLMLLPTGVLATLPFSALIPEQATEPLSERVTLSILPALTTHNDDGILEWQGTSGDRALVMGNPDLARHTDWQFPALPGAQAEAQAVAASMPGWAYFGADATAHHLFDFGKEADLIYLATHAVASDSDALDQSFVALSDQLVTPRDIQELHFRAGLAVLSACQTGLGVPHDGGTIGLARAFNLAGVPGVIMSLWNVDDEATKALMSSFMRHLESKAPQEALGLAMRERRKVDPNPARWASFMYFGFPMIEKSEQKDRQ